MASCVVMSSASISFSGTPYSAARSKEPARPASLITSAGSSMVSKWPLPSSPLTRRVMRLSAMRLAEAFGDEIDELLAAQDAQGVVGVHHSLMRPGQAEAGPGDHDRAGGRALRS